MTLDHFQTSPRTASARMRSAVRQAIAWIVSDGFRPLTVGNTEASHIQRLGMSQLRQSLLTTLFADCRANPGVRWRYQKGLRFGARGPLRADQQRCCTVVS